MTNNPNTLPLSQLAFGHDKGSSNINARKTNRLEAIDVLAQSIKHVGLVLPLAVVKNGSGKHYVVDGNRRLAALQKLAKEGTITKDHAVPVLVHEGELMDAKSLAANVTALPLHPVDKFERFSELSATMTEQQIADAFALKAKEVKQVLALGSLDPKVREAWRNGLIEGDAARAFTLAGTHKRQAEVLAKLTKERSLSAWAVKREIIGDDRQGALLNFVGIEAYEKAGGKVTVDLFGSDHVISNPVLLKKLADEAVEAKKAVLLAEGWSFAGTEQELGVNRWMMGSIHNKPKFTKEQAARVKELEAVLDGEGDEPANLQELEQEHADLLLAGEIAAFTPEQKKKSGCVLFRTPDGLEIDYGRVKPKSVKTAPPVSDAKATKKAKEQAGISNALNQRLSEQLNDAIADCLKNNPEVALRALVAGFGNNSLYSPGKPVCVYDRGLRLKRGDIHVKQTDFAHTFAALLKADRQHVLNAVAEIAARAVDTQVQNGKSPLLDKGIAALANAQKAADFRKAIHARFDFADYFASVNKVTALKAVEEAIGRDEARKLNAKSKVDIVAFCNKNVRPTGWLPPELRTDHYQAPKKR